MEQARRKLERESKGANGHKARAVAPAVRDALLTFCGQEEEFAQAVVQGGPFSECLGAVLRGAGDCLSDLEAYRRAVSFYFPGAEVRVIMRVDLRGSVQDAPRPDAPGVLLDLSDFF